MIVKMQFYTSISLLCGVICLHLVYLGSVFDIYFRSPIVSSRRLHRNTFIPPAKRMVLLVADGLRAETFYSYRTEIPFLTRLMIEVRSVYGISHTSIPTESRPGHISIVAGMYEDPSAIMRGWRHNPVDFDTIFNQSSNAWSWGSPDVVNMFSQHSITDSYSDTFEDFSLYNHSYLDTWVFDRVERFFRSAKTDPILKMQLNKNGVLLFLHLLGCDSTGHVSKPQSVEYHDCARVVDDGIRHISNIVDEFYQFDNRTAFLFTSDHGMTDWGSHGAGTDHETRTPIVAWGAGIRNLNCEALRGQCDINQIDIAPLVSTLLGINLPQNSAGHLPTVYLDMSNSNIIEASITNIRQRFEQYLTRKYEAENVYLAFLFHVPFVSLTYEIFHHRMRRIEWLATQSKYEDVFKELKQILDLCENGIVYYQMYHRSKLYLLIVSCHVGFFLLVLLFLFEERAWCKTKNYRSSTKLYILFISLCCFQTVSVIFQRLPLHFVVYYLTPLFIWYYLLKKILYNTINNTMYSVVCCKSYFLYFFATFFILESVIYAFFDRRFLSLAILGIMIWRFKVSSNRNNIYVKSLWLILCMILCLFTFQPSVGNHPNPSLVLFAGFLNVLFACYLLYFVRFVDASPFVSTDNSRLFYALILYDVLGCFCVCFTIIQGHLSIYVQLIVWLLFITSLPTAMLSRTVLCNRVLAIHLAIQCIYHLLCVSYEGVFLLFLMATLFTWLYMEFMDYSYVMTTTHWSKSLLHALSYLVFSIISFFGTGNIASLNSFDVQSIKSFVSIFNPFVMGALLLIKVALPMFTVSMMFVSIGRVSKINIYCLFLMLLLLVEIMGLHFFFLVNNEGSWLDIGSSLSHFIIAETTFIFLLIMYSLSNFLLHVVPYRIRCRKYVIF